MERETKLRAMCTSTVLALVIIATALTACGQLLPTPPAMCQALHIVEEEIGPAIAEVSSGADDARRRAAAREIAVLAVRIQGLANEAQDQRTADAITELGRLFEDDASAFFNAGVMESTGTRRYLELNRDVGDSC